MAQSEEVLYKAEDTYITLSSKPTKDDKVYGRLLVVQKADGAHVVWKAKEDHDIPLPNQPRNAETWAMVNVDAVGFKNDKMEEPIQTTSVTMDSDSEMHAVFTRSRAQKLSNKIDFSIKILKSFKRIPRSIRSPSYMIFILDDGTTHQPVYFQKGGSDKFIDELGKHVLVNQSNSDNNLFLVSQHQAHLLATSFDQLDLVSDKRSALERFAAQPISATWNAFAKVTGLLSDAFISQDPSLTMAPDFHEMLMNSIADESKSDLSTVNTGNEEDPDFLMVDEKIILPEVTRVERGEPLTAPIWNSLCNKDGAVNDEESVKHIIYRGGITHELRPEVWKFLLDYYPWKSTKQEREKLRQEKVDEYFLMKRQWMTMTPGQVSRFNDFKERQALIEKDVNRTDRILPFYSGDNNEKLTQLNDILMTYVMYNFNLGYVQGMSDLLSPILFVMKNEVDAFWCFVGFMNRVESNFELDQQGMKLQLSHLSQLLQITDIHLYNYLTSHDSNNMYFAFRWLLILFKREFSFTDIMRLWEVFWTQKPCKNYQLIMAVALLHKQSNAIIENQFGFTEILKYINDLSEHIDLEDLLVSAETLALQLLSCPKLPDYICRIIGQKSSDVTVAGSPDKTNKPMRPPPPNLPTELSTN